MIQRDIRHNSDIMDKGYHHDVRDTLEQEYSNHPRTLIKVSMEPDRKSGRLAL